MRRINMDTWPRREHFQMFNNFDYPQFNLTANVNLTQLHSFVKKNSLSINLAIIYLLTKAANEVPECRYRIRAGEVIEHKTVHPATTVLGINDVFSFCTMEYLDSFAAFAAKAAQRITQVREKPRLLEEDGGRDDLYYLTPIPWVSFTSIVHPLHWHPVDSVPRLAWGKFFKEDDSIKMPLSIQGHHALMDGLHAGRFFEKVEGYFQRPQVLLEPV